MVPSFVTTEPSGGVWRVVRKDFRDVEGQPILSVSKSTLLDPPYRDQAAAEAAAGAFAEAHGVRHIPNGKALVTVVYLGDKKKQLYVPILLKADGTMILEGDGLASSLGAAMEKAAHVARDKGFLSVPPIRE